MYNVIHVFGHVVVGDIESICVHVHTQITLNLLCALVKAYPG